MEKIYFGLNEFDTVVGGASVFGDQGTFKLIKGEDTVDEIVEKTSNCETIKVKSATGETLATYVGYTKFDSAVLDPEYVISVDPETGEPTTAAVVTVIVLKPTVEEQVAQNSANIDYIAMVEDIDLDQ